MSQALDQCSTRCFWFVVAAAVSSIDAACRAGAMDAPQGIPVRWQDGCGRDVTDAVRMVAALRRMVTEVQDETCAARQDCGGDRCGAAVGIRGH